MSKIMVVILTKIIPQNPHFCFFQRLYVATSPFIFKGLLDVYRGLTYQISSYEEFISPVAFTEALVNVFRQYSIFFPWVFILMVIAVKELYNLNNKKALFAVLIPYTGYFLVQIILTFFGYRFLTGT